MTVGKGRILIVDDERDVLDLLRMILEQEGFEVWEAINGKEALEQAQKLPNLVLLDYLMPGGLSGLAVCRRLKEDEKFKHIPIIISSAKVLDQDIELARQAGADAYLTRPFISKDLIQLIKKHLTQKTS